MFLKVILMSKLTDRSPALTYGCRRMNPIAQVVVKLGDTRRGCGAIGHIRRIISTGQPRFQKSKRSSTFVRRHL